MSRMARFSNGVIATLNILTLILSVPILGSGIWLSSRHSASTFEKFLATPIIAAGVAFLLVSLAGLVGSCCRITILLRINLLAMFVLIVLIFCFSMFALVVTNKGAGEVVSRRGFREYKLGDYSNWLQKRVGSGKNWERIRSCLEDTKVCRSLQENNQTLNQFINQNLSPIQSGCCKPPTSCNFTYRSDTIWDKPLGFSNNSSNSDCNTWQSNQTKLCYDCQSCKAGVLANIRKDWKKVAIVNIIVLIFLIIVYSVGCCAIRNNRQDNSYRMKGYP